MPHEEFYTSVIKTSIVHGRETVSFDGIEGEVGTSARYNLSNVEKVTETPQDENHVRLLVRFKSEDEDGEGGEPQN